MAASDLSPALSTATSPCQGTTHNSSAPPRLSLNSAPSGAARTSRASKKIHNFGKRSNSIKRSLNAPVVKRGWLYKQVRHQGALWFYKQANILHNHNPHTSAAVEPGRCDDMKAQPPAEPPPQWSLDLKARDDDSCAPPPHGVSVMCFDVTAFHSSFLLCLSPSRD
uniref:Uncharacterized protein n=1 Tax=Knipowitschia caucasica TaxID=637954 RepID=A0AAV2MH54_KNICA